MSYVKGSAFVTTQPISKQTLLRLPAYLNYLKQLAQTHAVHVSATGIAEALGLNQVQVRKDLALVSDGGKPKTGYQIRELIADIEHFLGYDNTNGAVLVGAGHLGRALLSYSGFKSYGLEIVAAFDENEAVIGTTINGHEVLSIHRMRDLCTRMKIHIGIITAPAEAAQQVCDRLVEGGVRAVWNFAPTILRVPEGILVQNENMAASLAVLSSHLSDKLKQER